VKKLSLAATVLSLCFLSFAQTPSAGRINTHFIGPYWAFWTRAARNRHGAP
jgi:hypothetical protein